MAEEGVTGALSITEPPPASGSGSEEVVDAGVFHVSRWNSSTRLGSRMSSAFTQDLPPGRSSPSPLDIGDFSPGVWSRAVLAPDRSPRLPPLWVGSPHPRAPPLLPHRDQQRASTKRHEM